MPIDDLADIARPTRDSNQVACMDLREARRLQTLFETERLRTEVDAWVTTRKEDDTDSTGYAGRYHTQLEVISNEVLQAVDRIRALVGDDVVAARSTGEVFRDYTLHDQRIIWVRYTWGYFRDKLDQRDDPTLRPILEAADEVSWSSYSALFRSAGLGVPAAPIPYIEYEYVPSALRTGQTHILNRSLAIDAGPLKDYFQSFPVPLLRLPPGVVTAPWALALICHEVGHLLQGHIEPQLGYLKTFSNLVSDSVKDIGGTEGDQNQWAGWSQEIFADMCMAVTLGPWAVWVLAPWVLTVDDAMAQPLDRYPAPVVRLHLLDRMAQAAKLPASNEILDGLTITPGEYPLADAVAGLVAKTVAVNGQTRTIGDYLQSSAADLKKNGRVEQWSSRLLRNEMLIAVNDQTSARDAAAATVQAHYYALRTDSDLEGLRRKSTLFMKQSHAKGVRAGNRPVLPTRSLSDSLFDLPDDELLGALAPTAGGGSG